MYQQVTMPLDRFELVDELQTLWVLYVVLQRSALLGDFFNAPAQIPAQNRVLQIPEEFHNVLIGANFDEQFADQFRNYFSNRINIESNIIKAMISQDQNEIDYYVREYTKNADVLAELMGRYPYWNESRWKELFYTDIRLFLDEILAILTGNYEKEIDIFEQILRNAQIIGRYMASGLTRRVI